ncbi:MAG: hypothetical protein ACF8R7_10510 [Phycisphaerales bacterium JB039]
METAQNRVALRVRLAAWVVVACAAMAAPLLLRAGAPELAAAAWSLTALSAMAGLLVTTPPGAIKLPWWASVLAVAGGAGLLVLGSGAPAGHLAPAATVALWLALLSALGATEEGRRWFRRGALRPAGTAWWWAALWLWHPLIWLPRAGGEPLLSCLGAGIPIGGLLLESASRPLRLAGSAIWAGSVAATLLVV